MWLYIVGAIICLCVIYVFVLYNSFIKLNNKVKEAFSTMDVYLKKRWDLIPNIVETVKGYSEHEKTTLENVIKARNKIYDNLSNEQKLQTNEILSQDITKIMALSESYPDLKASDNFSKLSAELTQIEDDIANARKYYNGTVRLFNNKVESFPNNIFAAILGYKSKTMFEATAEEKENVKIKL